MNPILLFVASTSVLATSLDPDWQESHLSQAEIARSNPVVALRGGLPAGPPGHAQALRIDPGWWKATTPPPSPTFKAGVAGESGGRKRRKKKGGLFDVEIPDCTPFLNMPGNFVANPDYWKDECKSIPKKATYIKMTVGGITDYFKPKPGKSMCEMLVSSDNHKWSSDGYEWTTVLKMSSSQTGLGGSADGWLQPDVNSTDKRDTPSFWGVKPPGVQTGGCCHSDYKATGKAWAKPFKMEYCGTPMALAPICTPLITVPGSFSADKAFWAQTCKQIPMTTRFVKVAMGDTVDYYRPPTDKDWCDMLTSGSHHKWSKDGVNFVTPKYDVSGLGGSADQGVTTGDARTKVNFWGSNTITDTGGCCYGSPTDKTPGFGKPFIMSSCEVATAPPMAQLVDLLHSNEKAVQDLEKTLSSLHSRLLNAETDSVHASGNVSLARSGMYKLAVTAKDDADNLKSFTMRSSLLGSKLDQAENQLKGSANQVQTAAKRAKAIAMVGKMVASSKGLSGQEKLNDKIWKLMDPKNVNSLDATEKRVRTMEKATNNFVRELRGEVKTIMVTKMRRETNRLRKAIHKLGTAGNKVDAGPLGETESSAPLGADLGLNDD